MRRALCLVACALLVWLALVLPAGAEGPDPLAFADSLCQGGDYYRAVGEYKRVLYLAPEGSPEQARARLHLGACLGRAGGYEEAAQLLGGVARSDSPLAEPALFELGLVHYQAGRPELAAEAFERLRGRFPARPLEASALALAGISQLAAADYAAAAASFERLAGRLPCAPELTAAATNPLPPQKSPLAAGLLSAALPGAGQLYCGRPAQAAASFVLTGLSVFGAWAAWSNDYAGAGTLASVVAAAFYSGSIRSAASGAREINRAARGSWLVGLAERCHLSLVPGQVAFAY